jgi:hypothetical protein
MRGSHQSTCLCALALSLVAAPPSSAGSAQPDQSTQAPTSTAAATPTTTTNASSTAASKPAPTSSSEVTLRAKDKDAEAQIKRLRAAGYKPVLVNGEVIFCRKEIAMDSHFQEKHCGTAARLAAEADSGRQDVEDRQRHSEVPWAN